MKKNVLVYGLISGICVATFMAVSVAYCYSKGSFEGSMLVGYAAMLLSFSVIFVGVKNYRDKYAGGVITFGKAFLMALIMSLIASTLYVAGWMIAYYNFFPDFIDKLAAYQLSPAMVAKMSAAEVKGVRQQMDMFREWYSTPLGVAGATYMEISPIVILTVILTPLILMRKKTKATAVVS